MLQMSDVVFELSPRTVVLGVDLIDERAPIALICLHGIRDDATFSDEFYFIPGFLDSRIRIIPISYPILDEVSFIFGLRRNSIAVDVLRSIRRARLRYPDHRFSLLAHSNATKIFSEIVDAVDLQFQIVFLCGSVCPTADMNRIEQFPSLIINECGSRDWWPIIAQFLRPSLFQATGCTGFGTDPIVDRYFSYGHAGALDITHVEKYILPVLKTGKYERTRKIGIGYRRLLPMYRLPIIGILLLSFYGVYQYRNNISDGVGTAVSIITGAIKIIIASI